MADFSNVLDEVKSDQINNKVISGDLYADLRHANGHRLVQLCNAQNILYLVQEPTRFNNTTATI